MAGLDMFHCSVYQFNCQVLPGYHWQSIVYLSEEVGHASFLFRGCSIGGFIDPMMSLECDHTQPTS